MLVIISLTTLAILANSFSWGLGLNAFNTGEKGKAESLDLNNPIDLEQQLQQQKSSSQTDDDEKLPQLPEWNPILPSLPSSDDPVDELRTQDMTHQGIGSKIAPKGDDRITLADHDDNRATEEKDDSRKLSHGWFPAGDVAHNRWQILEKITSEERRKELSDVIERQREYDRMVTTRSGATRHRPVRKAAEHDQFVRDRYPVRSQDDIPFGKDRFVGERYPVIPQNDNQSHRNRFFSDMYPVWSQNSNPVHKNRTLESNTDEIQTRIQMEREKEIQQEVEKALEKKRKFFEKIEQEKNRRTSLLPKSKYEEMELERTPEIVEETRQRWKTHSLPSDDRNSWREEENIRQWNERHPFHYNSERKRKPYPPISPETLGFKRKFDDHIIPSNDFEKNVEANRRRPQGFPESHQQWSEQSFLNDDIEKRRQYDRHGLTEFNRPQQQWREQVLYGDGIDLRGEEDRQESFPSATPRREQFRLVDDIEQQRERDRQRSSESMMNWDHPTQFREDIERKREEDRRRASGPMRFRRDFMSDRRYWLSDRPHDRDVDIRRPIDIRAHHRIERDQVRERLQEEEEEKLRNIERRRTQQVLNQQREGRIERPRQGRQHHHGSGKPPILIFEEVTVPIPVREYDHSNEFHDDEFHSDRPSHMPSKGLANPPPLIISDLYDPRAPDRDHPYLDRRPGRPDLDSENKIVHLEEGLLVHDAIVPGGVSVHLGVPVGPVVPVVDPTVEAHLALQSEAAAASHIERLNHAAAIADIKRLQNLQVADAVIKNQIKNQAIAHAHAVSKQAALEEAANLNRIQHAVALSNIKKQVSDATRVQAVSSQVALTEAAKQEAILSHSLINDQLVATALTEDHVSKSQKIDFINLVLKHGLRKVLREQLRQHLKTRSQQEAFIHKLQARKEDLIRRLLLLKPYFTSPGRGEFILPAFIPNIPVGAHLSHAQLSQLPKIHLLPSTHLLSPGFHLPNEIAASLQKEVDVGFVEHILRLPEKIFQRVLHIPKQDFILTLFPRLYRETIKHLQIDPEKHYYPNAPHGEVVKEHHHHHIHLHQPPSEKKPSHHHHHHPSKEITHSYGPPQNSQSQQVFSSEYDYDYTSTGPKQHEIILPTSKHKLQPISHDVHLPLEESSYVSYDPSPFGSHEHSDFHSHKPHHSTEIKFSSVPLKLSPDSFHPSGSELSGINVRIKGETGHESISSHPPNIFQHLLPFSSEFQGRFSSSRQHLDSDELISLGFRRNDQFTSEEHPHTSFSVTTSSPFSSSEISFTTLKPFSTGTVSTLRPSTLVPQPVRPSFRPPLTPRPFSTTSQSTTPIPTFITTTNTPFTPFLTTFETIGEEESDGDRNSPFTTTTPFRPSEIPTLSPVNPFEGFDGNIPLREPEMRKRVEESGTDLERPPGTDISDDEHLFSAFQKKKGNATRLDKNGLRRPGDRFEGHRDKHSNNEESVINQIRHITNIFGGRRAEDDGGNSRRGRSNFTAPTPTNFFSSMQDSHDESATPSNTLSFPSPHPPQAVIREKSPRNDEEIASLQSVDDTSQLPGIASKKTPMPTRVNLSRVQSVVPQSEKNDRPKNRQSLAFHSEGFRPSQAGFPFQGGPVATASRSAAAGSSNEVTGRGHSSFTGIPFRELGNLPKFLREAPRCSTEGPVKKSFCLYPNGYEREVAASVVGNNKNEIEKMIEILSKIPPPEVDFSVASKQIPNLDLSVKCETEDREVQLSWSRDIIGSWFSILQTEPFEQKVTVTTCGNSARAKGCRPLLQPRPFLAFHPEDSTRKPYIMEFPLPVGCVLASTSTDSNERPSSQ